MAISDSEVEASGARGKTAQSCRFGTRSKQRASKLPSGGELDADPAIRGVGINCLTSHISQIRPVSRLELVYEERRDLGCEPIRLDVKQVFCISARCSVMRRFYPFLMG